MAQTGPVCVSVINMKGGVGKTTIAALLSRYAFRPLNLDVLAIDLDPQANLSQAFMRERYRQFIDNQSPSIVEIFNGYQPPTSISTSPGPLDVTSLTIDIGSHNLQVIPSRFDFSDNLVNSLKPDERILARFISDHFPEPHIMLLATSLFPSGLSILQP